MMSTAPLKYLDNIQARAIASVIQTENMRHNVLQITSCFVDLGVLVRLISTHTPNQIFAAYSHKGNSIISAKQQRACAI